FPGGSNHINLSCGSCHIGNSQTNVWSTPAYQPDCAGCHANVYIPGKHQNASVSALRDCTGACHIPAGKHTVNKGW
ncbi:MAG: hypothetical protein O7F73_16900, partial [Gammaproteobacteria bacterium]|nr:hypothetical protein [Gammaproteobacteria bacterium]